MLPSAQKTAFACSFRCPRSRSFFTAAQRPHDVLNILARYQ